MRHSLVLGLVFFGLLALPANLSAQQGTAKQVEVVNEPLQVTGAVEVTNEPVEVTGAVEVSNLPQPSALPRFQLVGSTSATFTGIRGVLTYTLACQDEFPASRMCNSVEVLETVSVPDNLAAFAWVRPSFQPLPSFTDASGVTRGNADAFSCRGWRGSGSGLAVETNGSFLTLGCDIPRAIACCALVP
jgi:hypothetical protein